MAAIDPDAVKRVTALVMEKLGASGQTELAVKLGLVEQGVPNAPRLAANWISGVNAPRFDYTMLMLSKAGLLSVEAELAWRGESPDPTAEARAAGAAAREATARTKKLARAEPPRRAGGKR